MKCPSLQHFRRGAARVRTPWISVAAQAHGDGSRQAIHKRDLTETSVQSSLLVVV